MFIVRKKLIFIILLSISSFIFFNSPIKDVSADHHLNTKMLEIDKIFNQCTFILFEDDPMTKDTFKLFNKCNIGQTIKVQIGIEVDVKKIHGTSRALDMIAGWFCNINKPIHIKYPSISNRHASILCLRNSNKFPVKFFN